jgi:transposase-like protein
MRNTRRPKKPAVKKLPPPPCPQCGNNEAIRSGRVQQEQRWKCKECNYQYTRLAPRGRPVWQKSLVVFLYNSGMSMHAIAKIFDVQPSTVLKWLRIYGKEYPAVQDTGNILTMELGAMQKHLKKKRKEGVLCIAIDTDDFRKNLGITLTPRE